MSKPWGAIGAWAADVEAEEKVAAVAAATGEPESFPSLKEAATVTKPKKKKMALSEFVTGNYVARGGGRREFSELAKGLTPDEMLRLPTGPKERTPEELEKGRLGGGFRSFGHAAPHTRIHQDDASDRSWGGGVGGRRTYGGFEDDSRRPPPRILEFDQPSRADEVDNWAAAKKPTTFMGMDSGGPDRYASLGGTMGSRADEVDNWAAGKKSLPAQSSSSSFSSGFQNPGVKDSDRWSRGGQHDGDREQSRLMLDPPHGAVSMTEPARPRPNPFGAARPREEVLADKGLGWKKLDSAIETLKMSPTSSHSSRPSSAHSSRPGSPPAQVAEAVLTKPTQKANPFGDAKPREVLLQEQGKDWRKMDLELEHRGIDRPETEAEKMLKEEINELKKEMAKEAEVKSNGESIPGCAEECASLQDLLLKKVKDLELLIRELDDKVRFGQKAIDRPSSGAGRFAAVPERPLSQSSWSESSSSVELDRPQSRGTDLWTKSGDDRRSYQSGRERGFLSNKDSDRTRSRERW